MEAALSKRSFLTACERDEKIFDLPYSSTQSSITPLPYWTTQTPQVTCTSGGIGTRSDDRRKRGPTSPELPRLNYDIQDHIYAHKRQKWRDFVETLDQKTDVTKLWRTIKGIDGRAKREAENEVITFNGSSFSSSKQIAARFNQQFNTSKLGTHIFK